MDSGSEFNAVEIYQLLLESTRAVPWSIDWDSKKFKFISGQVESLLGWPISSWGTVEDWAERIHPQDRNDVVQFCTNQTISGINHEAEYRALSVDGRYVWVRDVVHVVRIGERVDSLVGFMLDITARKNATSSIVFKSTGQGAAPHSLLKEMYRFTKAETRLAIALTAGQTAKEYAYKNGVSVNTVRSQIRALLEKADVGRQADLIRILVNILPQAGDPAST